MKRNYHKEAIKILSDLNHEDMVRLVFDVAANNPSALVNAYEVRFPKPVVKRYDESDNWKIAAREYLKDRAGYVPAIKHCRDITGWDLKTSKDAVDALREKMKNEE